MAVQSTPYVETALNHSAELFRRELQSGLPLGSAGGVVPATLTSSANLTAGVAGCSDLQVTAGGGMSVNIAAGQVIVPGSLGSTTGYGMGTGYGYPTVTLNGGSAPTVASNAAATKISLTTQGAYYCYNDYSSGAVNLAIATSNPSNPRLDVVVAQVEDAAYSGSNNDWKLAVVTGTAAASPVVPSLPANVIILAYVWVGANVSSISSGNILDLRVAYNRNPFRAEMYRNSAWTGGTSDTIIPFDTVYLDPTGMCTTGAAALFTAPVAGVYLVNFGTGSTVVADPVTLLRLYQNGGFLRQLWDTISAGSSIAVNMASATTISMNVGDTTALYCRTTSTPAMTTGRSGTFACLNLIAPL